MDMITKSNWIAKYGVDFLRNYGEVNRENMIKFLDIDAHTFDHNINYKDMREKLNNERKALHTEKEN